MMDARELRLALKAKLDHRRELLARVKDLQRQVDVERANSAFLRDTLSNPLIEMALEECADQIMKAVVEHAARASSVVAERTVDGGDYEVGIDIPSLHIRHRVSRQNASFARDMPNKERRFERVRVRTA